MKVTFLALFILLVLTNSLLYSQNKVIIEIKKAEVAGNGCKLGTTKVFTFQSKGPSSSVDTILVEYDDFIAGKTAKSPSQFRKFCNLAIKVAIPIHSDPKKSYQFAMESIRNTGFLDIKSDVKGIVSNRYSIHKKLKLEAKKVFNSINSDFTVAFNEFLDSEGNPQDIYSDCGSELILNISTSIRLLGRADSKNQSEMVIDSITTDSDDERLNYPQNFNLKWRECDLSPQ